MIVYFYEKIGCANNTKQKALLRDSGFEVVSLDILNTEFENDELLEFFSGREIRDCFNPSAPDIKSGSIDFESLTKISMVEMMRANPILIKRPLIIFNGKKMVGFELMQKFLKVQPSQDIEKCSKEDKCN